MHISDLYDLFLRQHSTELLRARGVVYKDTLRCMIDAAGDCVTAGEIGEGITLYTLGICARRLLDLNHPGSRQVCAWNKPDAFVILYEKYRVDIL